MKFDISYSIFHIEFQLRIWFYDSMILFHIAINLEIVSVKSELHSRKTTYFYPFRFPFSESNALAEKKEILTNILKWYNTLAVNNWSVIVKTYLWMNVNRTVYIAENNVVLFKASWLLVLPEGKDSLCSQKTFKQNNICKLLLLLLHFK